MIFKTVQRKCLVASLLHPSTNSSYFEYKNWHKLEVNFSCIGYSSGVDLSHILWIMSHWDARVAPLVYVLRVWAAHNNVVSAKKPGPFITNFSLVIMTIFFLQNERILPTLQLLNNMSGELFGWD